MSSVKQNEIFLLGVIPSSARTPEQVAHWEKEGEAATYKLQRDPVNLEEFTQYNHRVVIWHENDTLTYISPEDKYAYPVIGTRRYLELVTCDQMFAFNIVGKTDAAVVETAEYFLSLNNSPEGTSKLFINDSSRNFRLRTMSFPCFKRMLEMDPRHDLEFELMTFSAERTQDSAPWLDLHFQYLTFSVEQSVLLATCATSLRLVSCSFEDKGSAFIGALENRNSSVDRLRMDGDLPFSDENLKRLFELEGIDHLDLPYTDDNKVSVQALSAKVNDLTIYSLVTPLTQFDVTSVNITAKKLTLELNIRTCNIFPTEPILSLLRRFADFSHFKGLSLYIEGPDNHDMAIPSCVASELARFILSNSCLQTFDLFGTLNCDAHIATLLLALKHHNRIRTLGLKVFNWPMAFGVNFIHLRELLACNRDIRVVNRSGEIYTDRCLIDKLYSLNRFLRASKGLAVEPALARGLLLPTALVEAASNDFQKSAVLLADHVDMLFEFIQVAQIEVEEAYVS
jgi:hypothetical protein